MTEPVESVSAAPPLIAIPTRRLYLATMMASGMVFVDMTAVNTALPAIQNDLGMNAPAALWVMEIYLLFLSALLMVGGALGDRFGRRRMFRLGVISFALASFACGLADSAPFLIAARAVQGITAALLAPSSLALLNASFPPQKRAEALGVWVAGTSLIVPLGPGLGGFLTDTLGWNWIFFLNIPVAIIALSASYAIPRPPWDPVEGGRLDLAGAATVTIGLGALIFAMIELPRLGVTSPLFWISLSCGIGGILAFIFVEHRVTLPMLPMELLRHPTFTGINLTAFLLFGGLHTSTFFLPFFLIQNHGFSALAAGASLFPLTVGISLLSRFSGRLVGRFGVRVLLIAGTLTAAAGTSLLAIGALSPDDNRFWGQLFPAICLLGIGMGMAITPLTSTAINAAGEGRGGIAAGINNTMARAGGLLAIALIGMISTWFFVTNLTLLLDASHLDPASYADLARQSLHLGAITLPTNLTSDAAAKLQTNLDILHQQSFALGMILCTGLIGGATLMVYSLVLRPK